MPTFDQLKYDIRVRERFLRKGLLTEAEVAKYLEATPDVEAQAVELDLKQSALLREPERVERASRPVQSVPPRAVLTAVRASEPVPVAVPAVDHASIEEEFAGLQVDTEEDRQDGFAEEP